MFRPASKVASFALSCPSTLAPTRFTSPAKRAPREEQVLPDREAVHVQAGLEGRAARIELPVDLGAGEVHLAREARAVARNRFCPTVRPAMVR